MNKNKVSAWIAIAITSLAAFIASGSAYFALVVAFILAALLTPICRSGSGLELLRDNTVDAELNINTILDFSLRAFKRAVLPLTAFATVFRNIQLKGTNKVQVPYFPLVTAASKDFDKCYVFDDDSNVSHREVTINKRKYQSFTVTGAEIARYPPAQARRDRHHVWRENRLRRSPGHLLCYHKRELRRRRFHRCCQHLR